jgi:hypothetical protein
MRGMSRSHKESGWLQAIFSEKDNEVTLENLMMTNKSG